MSTKATGGLTVPKMTSKTAGAVEEFPVCTPCCVSRDELKKKLTPLQFQITQEKGTERAFTGKFYKLKDDGMYSCVVCGEELFSSKAKYESGSGWPAFFEVVDQKKVKLKQDLSHGLVRTEVSCAKCQAHLGHLFDDGPKPSGKRFCINSVALNFSAAENGGGADPVATNGEKDAKDTNNQKLLSNQEESEATKYSNGTGALKPKRTS